jgi:hypothetical protein
MMGKLLHYCILVAQYRHSFSLAGWELLPPTRELHWDLEDHL